MSKCKCGIHGAAAAESARIDMWGQEYVYNQPSFCHRFLSWSSPHQRSNLSCVSCSSLTPTTLKGQSSNASQMAAQVPRLNQALINYSLTHFKPALLTSATTDGWLHLFQWHDAALQTSAAHKVKVFQRKSCVRLWINEWSKETFIIPSQFKALKKSLTDS